VASAPHLREREPQNFDQLTSVGATGGRQVSGQTRRNAVPESGRADEEKGIRGPGGREGVRKGGAKPYGSGGKLIPKKRFDTASAGRLVTSSVGGEG